MLENIKTKLHNIMDKNVVNEIQTTFNEDSLDILVEDGAIENAEEGEE